MHELPMPIITDLQNVIGTHWNKSWAVNNMPSTSSMTYEMLISLAEASEGSVHYSDGTFDELSSMQTQDLVRRFCDGEKLEGTVKLAIGDAAEGNLEDWKAAFPGANVRINYFLSTGPAKGLRPHYDNHHVFAMQLIGEKTWGLGPKIAVTSPEAPSFYPETDPSIEVTIRTKAGDVLYIPPGGWHGAETDTQSVHATVGIYPPTYAEYLRQLISSRATTDVILRSELPLALTGSGKEIRFNAPPLVVARELAERSTRVSWIDRTNLSSKLRLSQDAELTEEVARLTEKIWNESERHGRVALYLRGSAARPGIPGLQPWDIDLVLVTRQVVPDEDRRFDRGKIDGLELDIKYITIRDLISAERELPTRFLLRSEGVLLFGRDIVCELPSVKTSHLMATAVASRQTEACRINDQAFEEGVDDKVMIQRFAKAALRLATPLIMMQLNRLERDPVVCGWFISANYPDLRPASDYLIACVRGENNLSETRGMSRRLLDGLLPSLEKVGTSSHG